MAEHKRHMDVPKERFSEAPPQRPHPTFGRDFPEQMLVVLPRWISNGLPSGAPKNFLLLNSILESMGVGARGPFPKISEAMDGRREAHMDV
ncbi:hypothetical protein, partial [Marinobacter nauticus]|uniref:hypothetical protein n=1 Tax=Marinobacter nauticus TaxID=2743 RepID=UPI0035185F49